MQNTANIAVNDTVVTVRTAEGTAILTFDSLSRAEIYGGYMKTSDNFAGENLWTMCLLGDGAVVATSDLADTIEKVGTLSIHSNSTLSFAAGSDLYAISYDSPDRARTVFEALQQHSTDFVCCFFMLATKGQIRVAPVEAKEAEKSASEEAAPSTAPSIETMEARLATHKADIARYKAELLTLTGPTHKQRRRSLEGHISYTNRDIRGLEMYLAKAKHAAEKAATAQVTTEELEELNSASILPSEAPTPTDVVPFEKLAPEYHQTGAQVTVLGNSGQPIENYLCVGDKWDAVPYQRGGFSRYRTMADFLNGWSATADFIVSQEGMPTVQTTRPLGPYAERLQEAQERVAYLEGFGREYPDSAASVADELTEARRQLAQLIEENPETQPTQQDVGPTQSSTGEQSPTKIDLWKEHVTESRRIEEHALVANTESYMVYTLPRRQWTHFLRVRLAAKYPAMPEGFDELDEATQADCRQHADAVHALTAKVFESLANRYGKTLVETKPKRVRQVVTLDAETITGEQSPTNSLTDAERDELAGEAFHSNPVFRDALVNSRHAASTGEPTGATKSELRQMIDELTRERIEEWRTIGIISSPEVTVELPKFPTPLSIHSTLAEMEAMERDCTARIEATTEQIGAAMADRISTAELTTKLDFWTRELSTVREYLATKRAASEPDSSPESRPWESGEPLHYIPSDFFAHDWDGEGCYFCKSDKTEEGNHGDIYCHDCKRSFKADF